MHDSYFGLIVCAWIIIVCTTEKTLILVYGYPYCSYEVFFLSVSFWFLREGSNYLQYIVVLTFLNFIWFYMFNYKILEHEDSYYYQFTHLINLEKYQMFHTK